MEKAIRVLIVDDSAVVRQTLNDILSREPGIEVMATAPDAFVAAERIRREVPDVITLDIEMPGMDGITFLRKIMNQRPIPVVICSSLAGEGSETAMKALEFGAVEVIAKPRVGTKQFLEESRIRICDAVRAAYMARPRKINRAIREVAPKLTADAVIARAEGATTVETTEKIIIVGASTGGTEAIRVFLEVLPEDAPGTVIVQHMPENFTASFARRLDGLCRVSVKEAKNNDTVMRGQALIAPGNYHTLLKRNGSRYYVEVREGPLVSRHRPSVDVLFRSAARYAGRNAVGVIMTGMGDDGAKGLLEMKEAGAFTVAQDEETCVVFGMPQEAIKLGAAQRILPLEAIAGTVLAKTG
jgi:two-component system chemotaxis response regulator CheB